jgi:hypothetical protein
MRLRFLRTAADTNGELVEMEATYRPGSVEPLEHFHPRQEEHFEVVSGSLRARVGTDDRSLPAGDELDIRAANPLLGAALLHEFRGEFRPTSPPPAVQAVVVPALAMLARLLGQRP